jgi:hypothetical protein
MNRRSFLKAITAIPLTALASSVAAFEAVRSSVVTFRREKASFRGKTFYVEIISEDTPEQIARKIDDALEGPEMKG